VVYAWVLKGSKIEQQAVLEKNIGKKAKRSMAALFKSVLTNKPLLAAFIFMSVFQMIIFTQSLSASYLFRYYFQDFGKLSLYNSVRSLSIAGGTVLAIFWRKIFKDTKISILTADIGFILTLIATYAILPMGPIPFVVLTCVQNLLWGVNACLLLPLFAAAADFGVFKTGIRSDGLSMATYTLALKVGNATSAAFRAAVLATAGYSAALYVDGALPGESVMRTLRDLQSLYPIILAVVAMVVLFIFYPITDKQLTEVQAELARRDAAAKSAAS
jgi:Na+/melibiose symporter-like transporter